MNIKTVNNNIIILLYNFPLIDLNRIVQNKKANKQFNSISNNTISFSSNFNNNNYNNNSNNNNSTNITFTNTHKSVDATPQSQNKLNFNEICNFKMEINKLVEENIYLKTQLIDIKSKINQYDNILERTDLKYQDQINNYQKQIIKYNSYIHEIYIFFNNITKNYLPELNFSLEKNESLLISFDLFQKKLKHIEKYICELNKNLNHYKSNNLSNRIMTDISTNNPTFQNNGYFLTEFNKDKTSLEERINNLEKKIINRGNYNNNKINNKNIPFSKNKNINNSLVSKYHYGNNISIKDHPNKYFKKINNNNFIKNNERYKSAFGKSSYSSSKKSSSELNSKSKNYNKNNDLKFLKKSIPFKSKRTLTPLPK